MRKLKNEELNRIDVKTFKLIDKLPFVIVLDNVRSLNNVGSVFRTADAFRVEEIYLCGITGTPPNKEIHKTALGATESVDWKYYNKTLDAIIYLRSKGYIVASVEQVENSVMLDKFVPEKDKKYAFVFGNEIKGVDQIIVDNSDLCIEIPQFGTKHSFNIAVSAGIVVWHFFLKR